MADGDTFACELEESRSKLLLGPVPHGSNRRVELAKRMQLWSEGAYMALLARIEHRLRARHFNAGRGPGRHAARASRARTLIHEGAYSKATASLSTEVAVLNDQEQQTWSSTLLPCSARPQNALASRAEEMPAAALTEEHKPRSALAGVRFKAMSGAGPRGMRPEHLRELVAVTLLTGNI